MYNHAPKDYDCPFCKIARREVFEAFDLSHLIYQDSDISAFISSKQWPNNPGIVIIIPNRHFENIYDTPDELLGRIHIFAKKVAIAMKKTYKCDGVSTRQHNEPAGNQDVWHYHFQVLPRYINDELYIKHNNKMDISSGERSKYVKLLKPYLNAK